MDKCEDCIRGEFNVIKKLVFFLLTVLVLGTAFGTTADLVQGNTNTKQDTKIDAIEKKQVETDRKLEQMNDKLDKVLTAVTRQTVMLEQHMDKTN